ncbi:hypothetical protein LWC05_16670 [Acetobacter sicerae]|uniref:DUF883 domain-containing protein n=1 Tax=Acetobacter sicerae TaxID=85325 RepID=A0ABS8W2R1_9PROT|nr:hypothetical protein [Acetobacter sicerae]MCE0745506.1 hypothetical protein [Acetobacter sicerae]
MNNRDIAKELQQYNNVLPFKDKDVVQSGGGGYNGGMETRIAVLEQIAKDTKETLKEIREDQRVMRSSQERDFRLLFGALISGALGLAALMAHGFKWL